MSYHNAYRARLPSALDSEAVTLSICQQPLQALVTNEHKEKTRKAIDPPPILQLKVDESRIHDQRRNWLVSPFMFMNVVLVEQSEDQTQGPYRALPGSNLLGQTVSSLHRLKDVHNTDGGFFVFGDISCRRQGTYRLQFNLFDFENNSSEAVFVTSKVSEPFHVVTAKDFHGQQESTPLSRKFSEQGVRLRLRKEHRSLAGRKRSYDDSPAQSSAPPLAPNLMPSAHSDRSYGHQEVKRHRSGDYHAQSYYPPQIPTNSMFPYGTNVLSNGYGLSGQAAQNNQLDSRSSYGGGVGQSYSLADPNTSWQRSMPPALPHGQQAATVGGYGAGSYLHSMTSTASLQRSQTTPIQQTQQGQHTPIGTAEDPLAALGGLHTPNSLSDSNRTSTSSQQQGFASVAQEGPTHGSGFGTAQSSYALQHAQDGGDPQSGFDYRASVPNQFLQDYPPHMQPPSSNASYHPTVPADRAVGRYDHFNAAGGAENPYSESARDSFQSDAPNHLSDADAALDTGILHRGFLPPFSSDPQTSGLERSAPHFKDPPYPTPQQTSPIG